MGQKVHGQNVAVDIGGTEICIETCDLALSKDLVESTTSCDTGRTYLQGKENHTLNPGGPLEFGTGSTEASMWAAWSSTSDVAWQISPDGTDTASDTNPIFSGNMRVQSLTLSFGITAPIRFSSNLQGIGAAARATS